MAEPERVRVDVVFDGGQALSALISTADADKLARALAQSEEGTLTFESDGGRYSLVLQRIVYVKRHAREAHLGFGG